MINNVYVFDPTAPGVIGNRQKRYPLDALRGKVVGFIDNAKPNFNHLIEDLEQLLVGLHGVKSTMKFQKGGASIPVPDSVLKDLAVQCDLIIAGSGD